MSLLLLLCSTLFMHSHSLSLDQIHLALSENEVKEVFSARSHEEVPEYKLLRIRSRSRRHSDGTVSKQVSLSVFGEQHNLQLSRNSDLGAETFQIFYADAGPDGSTDFQRAEEAEMMDVGDPYQDAESGAALLIHHDPYTDALLLDGTIGPELVIRPAPESVRYHLDREAEQDLNSLKPDDELFLDQDENLQDERIAEDGFPMHHLMDLQGEHTRMQHHNNTIDNHRSRTRRRVHRPLAEGLHFVYKRATPPSMADYSLMEMDAMPKAPRRHRRSAPSVIYPEVLLIIDYDGFLLHDQDSNKIKKYFTSFMNGVDLRYRALRNPEIKVNMAGMIISRRADATPYLEKNMVTRDSIDSAAALTDMGKYLFEERRLPTYDIAMAITKHDLCRRRKSGICTKGTAGFAYVGGACVVNKRLTKVNSVAIVEDTGGFSGIIVAAHELGHLLGNVHDGSPPPSYLGGPGARRCRWEEGYIMSDLRHTEKGFKWSPCSLEEFDHFLNGETATCLYNAPHERHQLDRHLPGKLLSLDAQCKRDRGTSACFKDDRVCSQLFCFDQSTGYCVSYRPAAEGSACGHGKYCRDGYCVTDDSFGNGLGQFSYTSNDFFTSATHTRAVWTDPPSPEKSTTKSGWNKLVNEPHRSTRELAATTETSASSFGAAETSSVQPKPRKAPGRSKWQTPKAAVRTTLKPQSDVTSSPVLKEDRTRRPTTRRPTTTKQRITSRFPWRRRYTASTSTTTPTPRVSDNTIPQSTDDDDVCDDLVLRLVGNLNCKQFIERYGMRYCDRKYFQRNCCATRRRFCDSSVLSER